LIKQNYLPKKTQNTSTRLKTAREPIAPKFLVKIPLKKNLTVFATSSVQTDLRSAGFAMPVPVNVFEHMPETLWPIMIPPESSITFAAVSKHIRGTLCRLQLHAGGGLDMNICARTTATHAEVPVDGTGASKMKRFTVALNAYSVFGRITRLSVRGFSEHSHLQAHALYDMQTLADGLNTLPHLTELDVSENAGGFYGVLAIVQALGQNPRMRSLNLSKTGLNQLGFITPTQPYGAIVSHLGNLALVSLNLSGNDMRHGAGHSLKGLYRMTSLRSLDLSNNQLCFRANLLPPQPLLWVCDLMRRANIETLLLNRNRFGFSGMRDISRALPLFTSLTELGVADNRLSVEHMRDLASAVAAAPHLRVLNLSGNAEHYASMYHFIPSLMDSNISTLVLHRAMIFGISAEMLFKALPLITTLQTLDIQDNNMEDDEPVVLGLELNTSLRVLNLRGNPVCRSDRIAAAWVHNQNAQRALCNLFI